MKKHVLILLWVLMILMVAACGESAPQKEALSEQEELYLEIREKTPLPTIELMDPKDERVTLSAPDDGILVVNFWASWCGYCREEMDYFLRLKEEHPDVTVAIVNVLDGAGSTYSEEERANVRSLAEEFSISEDCYIDDLGQAASAFQIRSVPLTLFIDEQNNICLRFPGAFVSYEELVEWLNCVQKYH